MMSNKGMLPWLFQRISAAVLVLGLLVHFVVLHFMIERPVTMEKVAERLKSPGWIAFDSILLIACVYHALNGLNSVLLDFCPSRRLEGVVSYALWAVGFVAVILGIINLIPFGR